MTGLRHRVPLKRHLQLNSGCLTTYPAMREDVQLHLETHLCRNFQGPVRRPSFGDVAGAKGQRCDARGF